MAYNRVADDLIQSRYWNNVKKKYKSFMINRNDN